MALSRRYQMDIYPGPLGTVDFVSMPGKRPSGAIIVGLGDVGEITADRLRAAVLRAALHYANAIAEDPQPQQRPGWRSAAFSALLMGTRGSQPLSVQASSAAIIQA